MSLRIVFKEPADFKKYSSKVMTVLVSKFCRPCAWDDISKTIIVHEDVDASQLRKEVKAGLPEDIEFKINADGP